MRPAAVLLPLLQFVAAASEVPSEPSSAFAPPCGDRGLDTAACAPAVASAPRSGANLMQKTLASSTMEEEVEDEAAVVAEPAPSVASAPGGGANLMQRMAVHSQAVVSEDAEAEEEALADFQRAPGQASGMRLMQSVVAPGIIMADEDAEAERADAAAPRGGFWPLAGGTNLMQRHAISEAVVAEAEPAPVAARLSVHSQAVVSEDAELEGEAEVGAQRALGGASGVRLMQSVVAPGTIMADEDAKADCADGGGSCPLASGTWPLAGGTNLMQRRAISKAMMAEAEAEPAPVAASAPGDGGAVAPAGGANLMQRLAVHSQAIVSEDAELEGEAEAGAQRAPGGASGMRLMQGVVAPGIIMADEDAEAGIADAAAPGGGFWPLAGGTNLMQRRAVSKAMTAEAEA